jgi:hypothetical protein
MAGGTFLKCKALPGFFLCIFSCLKKRCFQQAASSSAVEGTSQPGYTGIQRKVLASLSLFLKSEKIPALLYVGK